MTIWCRIILGLAGICGASGVGLAAVAAHVAGGGILATAAEFLVVHAAAAAALLALAGRAGRGEAIVMAAATALVGGVLLFSGDLALRQLAGSRLLWGAAPAGGMIMIAGWIAVIAAALAAKPR